jgi:hypothetical protein
MTSEREPRMTRVFSHIKSNAVAYLALFVALGGTSYAALRIPAGSVGARQLKNHSITPIKFDRSAIGGYVRYWAKIDAAGTISASRPRAHLVDWINQPTATFPGGLVSWNKAIPSACFALATTAGPSDTGGVTPVAVELMSAGNRNAPGVGAKVLLSQPQTAVNVAIVCPQP